MELCRVLELVSMHEHNYEWYVQLNALNPADSLLKPFIWLRVTNTFLRPPWSLG